MYKIILSFALFISVQSYAQISSGWDIGEIDTCYFSLTDNCYETDSINQGLWQIGNTNKVFFDTITALMTDTINPYPDMADESIVFKIPINNNIPDNISVEFIHKFQTDTLKDGGIVEASFDNGANWHNVTYDDTVQQVSMNSFIQFYSENLYGLTDSLTNNQLGFSGTSDWMTTRLFWHFFFILKTQEIYVDTLYLKFRFVSDNSNNSKDGWIIKGLIITKFITGLEKTSQSIDVQKLYPNPTTGKVNIQLPTSEPIEIILYTLQGQEIQRNTLNRSGHTSTGSARQTIDISHLSKGVYFYQLRTDSGTATGKIIKE